MEKELKKLENTIALLLFLLVAASCRAAFATPQPAPEIIMFEQDGCEWCAVWDEQIAPVLPKTPEGKCASFRRVDIHDKNADILRRLKPIIYTPTFVVMENGEEVGRVLGYAGEDFFWFHLSRELKKLKTPCKLSG